MKYSTEPGGSLGGAQGGTRRRRSTSGRGIGGLLRRLAAGGAAVGLLALAGLSAELPPAAVGPVDFERDVRPIFAKHCHSCHGPDKQKSDLRLDVRAAALRGGDSGKAIEPGKGTESRIVRYVAGLDPEKLMPPKGDRLTPIQIGVLRAWIDAGASWPESTEPVRSTHWSFQPLRPVPVPAGASHPVDAFIRVRLREAGLPPSAPASRAALIRRVTFDLTGLPPTPAEVTAFEQDPSTRAYDDLVERLLASPHYGERWARHWLDVARYTESQGFEYDRLRDRAWHYRDYVIRSLNRDLPYDRFMQEQVAGDILEPVTSDGIVAASLLVCGPWDQAGNAQANATQRAITREDELEDLIGVVGQSFLGLTLNCARCHAHKFDPISQEEYYRIKACFEGVKHGERSIEDPTVAIRREREVAATQRELADAEARVAKLETAGGERVLKRRGVTPAGKGPVPWQQWTFSEPASIGGGKLHGGAAIGEGRLRLPGDGAFLQLPPLGRDLREKTLEVWVSLADLSQGGGGAISVENEDGSQFDAIVFGERQRGKWTAGSEGFARTRDLEAAEEIAPAGAWVHLAVVYGPDRRVSVFRNGEPYGKPYTVDQPFPTYRAGKAFVSLGRRHQGGGRPWLHGAIRQASVYDRPLQPEEVKASFLAAGWSVSREESVAALMEPECRERTELLSLVGRAQSKLAAAKAVTVPVSYVGTRVQPAPTRRLRRGEVTSPEETVTPGALSALAPLSPDFGLAADAPEAERRRRFAAWLADPRNPLPARVLVNRVWHFHFGQGLVATPNDFGASGSRPTHPELLDWLAQRFQAGGWSLKELHRLIVRSETYRQQSAWNSHAATVDADNQWLWRYSPRRLEAEAARDAMLAASGDLNATLGGPSFRPFTITEFNAAFYHPIDRAEPDFNRRTVYRVNVNSGKDPLLDSLDCPDPSVKTPRRGVTTTPLQALELMNNAFVQRQADALAQRVRREASGRMEDAVVRAYQLALGRPPSASERLRAVAAAEARGLRSLCWALFNSTEFVYVE